MKVLIPLLLLLFAVVAQGEEVYNSPALRELATHQRFFVETVNEESSEGSYNMAKLELLVRLIKEKNAPPRFIDALQAAFETSKVQSLENGSILVQFQKHDKTTSNAFDNQVQIKNFKGNVEDLFKILTSTIPEIRFNPSFKGAHEMKALYDTLFEVTAFDGSVRDLLMLIVRQSKVFNGYIAYFNSPSEKKDILVGFLIAGKS